VWLFQVAERVIAAEGAVLVSARTALVNAARGLVKSYGERLRKCGTQQFRRETTSGLSADCARPWSRCCERWNHMRRLLNQTANAAARTKGSIFEIVYRRSVPRLGHNQAIGAIAHRQCRLIWLILHQGVRYEERGPAVTKQSKQKRAARMIRQLRSLGYRIEQPNPQPSQAQA
jgi:hypothetical protein